MRRLFLLCAAALIAGACANNELQSILSEVSSVIDDDPARAMSLLESVSLDDCRGEKQRAEYALLKSKALDKNYIDVTDDSLIRLATSYYEGSGTEEEMMSWYYLGLVQYHNDDIIDAAISLDKSEEIAQSLSQYHYLGLINRYKMELYGASFDNEHSLTFAKKSLDYFRLAEEKVYEEYAVLSLSLTLRKALRYDEALETLSLLKSSEDPLVVAEADRIAASLFFYRAPSEPDSALYYYSKAAEINPSIYFDASDLANMSVMLAAKGDTAASDSLFQIVNESARAGIYPAINYDLFRLSEIKGDYKSALEYYRKFAADQDSLIKAELSKSVSHARGEYYRSTAERQRIVSRNRIILLILSVIIVLIISLIIISNLLNRQKRMKSELTRMLDIADEFEALKFEYSEISGVVDSLVMDKVSNTQRLAEDFFMFGGQNDAEWLKNKKGLHTPDEFLKAFNKSLDEIRRDKTFLPILEDILNKKKDGLILRFRSRFEHNKAKGMHMDKNDIEIYTLLSSGFSIKAISYLTGLPDYVISTRKARYYQKCSLLPEEESLLFTTAMTPGKPKSDM